MDKNQVIFNSESGEVKYSDIVGALRKIEISLGDILFVHSSLFSFGRLAEIKNKEELADFFIEALLESVGPSGTVILPTFTFAFCRKGFFDSQNTKSEVGLLSEVFRKRKDVVQSSHPIYSVAVWGREKEYFLKVNLNTCFGQGGPFDLVHQKKKVKILFIGLSVASLSQIHYIEELIQVPYRYMKKFSGEADGRQTVVDFYVRDLDNKAQMDMKKLVPLAEGNNLIKKCKLGDSSISVIQESDVHELIYKKMKQDSNYFLKTPYQKVINYGTK